MVRVKEWKDLAKNSNLSMLKFIMKHVEKSLDFTGEDENTSRKALMKANQTFQHELQLLKQDLELKSRAYDALDSELTTMRNRPWMTPMEEGMRVIAQNLTALFENRKRINYNELLPLLGVKPTDTVLVQGINRQNTLAPQRPLEGVVFATLCCEIGRSFNREVAHRFH